jgi:Protein of unknown function (DUF3021)
MLKKILLRAFGGFAFGVFFGQITQLIISTFVGTGEFIPVTKEYADLFSNELSAVSVQFFLTGLIGVTFGIGSFIFEIDRWGLLKQHVVHFLMTSVVWLPVVIICWKPQSTTGVLILAVNFIFAYVLTYMIQLLNAKKDIQKINTVLQKGEAGVK